MKRLAGTLAALALAGAGLATGLTLTLTGSNSYDWLGAYNAATDGATITVPGSSSGEVDLYTCSSKHVTFIGQGDSTYVSKIDDGCASNVTFQNMRVGVIIVQNANKPAGTTHDVTIDHVNGNLFYIQGPAANVTVTNGVWSDVTDSHPTVQQYNPGENGPSHVLIANNTFHDFHRSNGGVHTECLQIRQGSDVTVRNNKMWNCDGTAALTIGDAPQHNFLVEGNHLGLGGDGPYSAQIGNSVDGLIFRGNVATGIVVWGSPPGTPAPTGSIVFDSNLLVWSSGLCRYGVFTSNRMTGGTCSASDTQVASLNTVNLTDNLDQAGGVPPPPPPPTTTTVPTTTVPTPTIPAPPPPPVYAPKCATACDEKIVEAKKQLNLQVRDWRAAGWTWTKVKATPAWAALKALS